MEATPVREASLQGAELFDILTKRLLRCKGRLIHPSAELNLPQLDFNLNHWRYFFRATQARMLSVPGYSPGRDKNWSDIYVDYTDDETFNASTFHDGGRDFIAINSGATVCCYSIANFLMSLPLVFPDVGSSSSEIWTAEISGGLVEAARKLAKVPLCPLRRAFANSIAEDMLEFLFLHEVGHVIGGHARFTQATCGLGVISELSETLTVPMEILHRFH